MKIRVMGSVVLWGELVSVHECSAKVQRLKPSNFCRRINNFICRKKDTSHKSLLSVAKKRLRDKENNEFGSIFTSKQTLWVIVIDES